MQRDMHYEGMYVLARAAGLAPDIALRVATSSQLVDDFAREFDEPLPDGGHLTVFPTCHHTENIAGNLDRNHQRLIWVPFHFLPGGTGSSYEPRLVCERNSAASRSMMEHHLAYPTGDILPELIGVAAHVYADTFAHYGFSGISSDLNHVEGGSLDITMDINDSERERIEEKKDNFLAKMAQLGSQGLGHAGVATWPDRPYLKWRFTYEDGRPAPRDNPATFLEACRALHAGFSRLAQRDGMAAGAGVPFAAIEAGVVSILAHQGPMEERCERWKDALSTGMVPRLLAEIPDYEGTDWDNACSAAHGCMDAVTMPFCRFVRAAEVHRTYVLRSLLPPMNILVA